MKPALLLVDLQEDFLKTDALQPAKEILVSQTAALLQNCRRQKIPVIHVWMTLSRKDDRRLPHWKRAHRWFCVAGTRGHHTPAGLLPDKSETVIPKTGFNGFAGGELDAALKKLGCDTVIIAGLMLHTCVRAVAVEGLERGLKIFIAENAVATNDPVLAAATRRWLVKRCVEFLPANEILSRLDGRPPSKFVHRSPRDGKLLFAIPVAGSKQISLATRAAKTAQTKWCRKNLSARCEILGRIAGLLEKSAPRFARRMALEIGKPVSHGFEETRRAAASVRDVIARAKNFDFIRYEKAGIVRHEPVGVVALISPFNNPVAIAVGKIAPALIYGNTVVWKPAPAATGISAVILKLLHQAGVPKNAVRIVTGDHSTAQKLAADENVDVVTITGSAPAGHAIQEICARKFRPLQAELSGNNAAIVWDDADLKLAAQSVAWGAFGFAGQRCTANRRVVVSGKIYAEFRHELKLAAEKLNFGDPLEKSTDVGPVLHAEKCGEHLSLVEIAQNSGTAGEVEFLFAARTKSLRKKSAAYAPPVIVGCDDPEHLIVQEETMSPLLVVQRAKNFPRALELCNGVRHGLAAALFSRSEKLQKQFLAGARAGILKLNSTTAGVDVTLPFGGWKMSGLGPPEHGDGDRLFYTRMQAVYGLKNSSP